jgi:hypothetical protein
MTIAAANIASLYKMDDNAASTVVIDSGFNGYTATSIRNTNLLQTKGKIDGSLLFDGTNDYINTNNTFQSILQKDFTFCAWFKPDNGRPAADNIIVSMMNSLSLNMFVVKLNVSGKMRADYSPGTLGPHITTTSAFASGVSGWHFIAVVVRQVLSNCTIDVFLDGSYKGSDSAAGLMSNFNSGTDNLYIGTNYTGGFKFKGLIDNATIFDTLVPSQSLMQLYLEPDYSRNLNENWTF